MGTIPLVDESPERGLILRVQLQALPTGEGGRTQPIGDHYRGALSLQEWEEGLPWVYDVCLVFEEGEQLAPGEEGSALLWVLSPHLLPESLQIGVSTSCWRVSARSRAGGFWLSCPAPA